MADQEHLEMLKRGVDLWNAWRKHSEIRPDLSEADLSGANLCKASLSEADLRYANLDRADLSGADLFRANLSGASLQGVDLSGADLRYANLSETNLIRAFLDEADLSEANLQGADLRKADLIRTDLNGANLSGANLSPASLQGADLIRANLSGANLGGASLIRTDLIEADLSGANLQGAGIGDTVFARIDLRNTKGLTEMEYFSPSIVELSTIQLPPDGSALHFLRGLGVPDEWLDDYCARMMHPIQYHSCFISYSSKDEMLAHRLHADLQAQGVRCWFAPHDMKIGDKIRPRINEAIHLQEKLLLLLSKHALASSWVETEVEAALDKERKQHREVLFPVQLDASVMRIAQGWATQLRRERHIGDFTHWKDPQAYQQAFDRLLRDLKKADGQPSQEMES